MKITKLILIGCLSLGLVNLNLLTGCSVDSSQTNTIDNISVTELNQLLTTQPQGRYLIDVRTQSEWETVRAAPALHMPMADVSAEELLKRSISQDDTIYLICASGSRSAKVTQQLKQQGFTNVVNVAGGTQAWVAAGLPVIE
jgi:rhodanese-related sulfurtransferase